MGSQGGGLSRFNGNNFKHYSLANGLPGSDVNIIQQDNNSTIWVGTNAGIAYLKKDSFITVNGNFKTPLGAINKGLKLKNGTLIWITENQGFYFLDKENILKHVSKSEGLADSVINDAVEDKEGNLWLATMKGLSKISKWQNLQIENYDQKNGLLTTQLSQILINKKQEIWVSSWGGNIAKFDSKSKIFTVYRLSPQLFESPIVSLAADSSGMLWLGTLGNGAVLFNGSTFKSYASGSFLSKDFINKVFCDKNGVLWFIASDETLYRLDQGRAGNISAVSTAQGLSDNQVRSIMQDREGNLWIATAKGGTNKLSGEAVKFFPSTEGNGGLACTASGNQFAAAIFEDGKALITKDYKTFSTYNLNLPSTSRVNCGTIQHNTLWLGTLGAGLLRLNLDAAPALVQSASPGSYIYAVFFDKDQNQWLSLGDGIYRKKNAGFEKLLASKSNRQDYYSGILQLGNNAIVAAGEHHKVFVYKENVQEFYTKSLLSGALATGHSANQFLAGTQGEGIAELSYKDGLLSEKKVLSPEAIGYAAVVSLARENKSYDSYVWIGTTNGLYKAQWKEDKLVIKKRYSPTDGFRSIVFTHNALSVRNAQVLAGTVSGLAWMDLIREKPNLVAPETVIEGIRVFNIKADLNQFADGFDENKLPVNLSLPHDNNHLSFDFAGLSYSMADKVLYKCRLAGADKAWLPAQKETYATYASLAPGDYTFEVMACNSDGIWDPSPARFSFKIKAPFYLWWPFWLAMAIVSAAAIIFIFRWRVSTIRHTQNLKQKVAESEQKALRAQMNPHFIFNSLNSIQYFITDKDTSSANKYLSKFSRLMRKVLDNSRANTITLNEEIETLKLYLDLEELRFEGKFHYKINISENVDVYSVEIPAMLLQPYLENAIWHGFKEKKEAEVSIHFAMHNEQTLLCEITDNGIGRKKAAELKMKHPTDHKSSGMQITKNRLESVSAMRGKEATLEIKDLEDSHGEALGTKVCMLIPV